MHPRVIIFLCVGVACDGNAPAQHWCQKWDPWPRIPKKRKELSRAIREERLRARRKELSRAIREELLRAIQQDDGGQPQEQRLQRLQRLQRGTVTRERNDGGRGPPERLRGFGEDAVGMEGNQELIAGLALEAREAGPRKGSEFRWYRSRWVMDPSVLCSSLFSPCVPPTYPLSPICNLFLDMFQ